MAEEAESTKRAEAAGLKEYEEGVEGAVEAREQKLEAASANGDSNSPAAPDVTYDTTILEAHVQSSTTTSTGGDPTKEKSDAEEGEEEGREVGEKAGQDGSGTKQETVRSEDGEKEQTKEKRTEGGENSGAKEEEKEEWMDILGSGELKKKVLRPGGGGVVTRPTPQCRVKLRTKGQLENGTVVDKHHAVSFTLGDGDVIQAWDLTVSLMEAGEVALVQTTPRFAYGRQGRCPDIPSDASITYELELLDVQGPVDFAKVSEEELMTLVDYKRIRGNEVFQRKDYQLAINSYDKALKLVEGYVAEQGASAMTSKVSEMQVRCLNNLAAAQLKVEMYKESQATCQKVLEKDPDNVKALFRYGKVLAIQGELSPALKHLQKALNLNPQERAIQVELQKTLKKKERVDKEEREMYKRMVEGVPEKKGQTSTRKKGSTRQEKWGPLPYLAVATLVASVGIGLAYFLTQR